MPNNQQLNETFINDFGKRTLRFIQSKSKNVAEIRSIQASFVRNITDILQTAAIEKIINDAKLDVAEENAQQLRSEISDRQKRLLEIETEVAAKRIANSEQGTQTNVNTTSTSQNTNNASLLEDDNDELFSQVDIQEYISLATDSSSVAANTSSQDDAFE